MPLATSRTSSAGAYQPHQVSSSVSVPTKVGVHCDAEMESMASVKLAEHWRDTAEKVLGQPIHSLSTEGGNPIREDRAVKEKPSSDINLAQLREVAQDSNATQNDWLVGDQVLSGDEQPGPWEMDSLVYIQQENGQRVQKESLFFQNMLKVAQGEQP